MRYAILALILPTAAQAETLTVMTYDSFVAEWGPGPAIKTAFEAECDCTLDFIATGDGAALLARLRLEGARTDADVVLGLDTNLMADAKATGLFAPHGQTPTLDLPVDWTDDTFLPFDWGWFAFVHNTDLNPPTSFEELAASDLKVVIQDPRSSTPGLGLVMWVKAAYGDHAPEIWQALSDNILTVTPGWSEAYGLFTEGEADMVLSYSTSPAYHIVAEGDATKAAAIFTEGHYLQVEVAGKIAATAQPDLADRFLRFMLTEGFQSAIPETNWMYPAHGAVPQAIADLPKPTKTLLFPADEAADIRAEAIAEWRSALSR